MHDPPATHAKHPRIDGFIRQHIVEGKLQPGDRIPTWDELEQQFGVSRGTVLQAIRRLKHDGFLVTRGSGGTFVAPVLPHLSHFGVVFRHHPDTRDRWSRFEALVQQEAERAMVERPGQLHLYHDVKPTAESPSFAKLTDDVQRHRLAGLILVHMGRELRGTPVLDMPGPQRVVVSFASDLPGVPSVYPDRAAFIDRALDELARRGRQRVAMIVQGFGGPDSEPIPTWRNAIRQRGMVTHDRWVQTAPLHPKRWARHVAELLVTPARDAGPDALIVGDDHLIHEVSIGVKNAGARPPQDLELISWGNFPGCPETAVPVTWIGADMTRLVETCFDVLERSARGEDVPRMTHLPVELRPAQV